MYSAYLPIFMVLLFLLLSSHDDLVINDGDDLG